MNLAATVARSLQAGMQAELRNLERAAAAGTMEAGRGLKSVLRRQVASAGFGQRLANSWRDKHYPNQKLDAASLVYTKAPQIIRAFREEHLEAQQSSSKGALKPASYSEPGAGRRGTTSR